MKETKQEENTKVATTITLRKLFKKIKKFLKRLYYKIIFFFNKKSERIPEKIRKKLKKEYEEKKQFSKWGNFCLWVTGCNNLKAQPA